jgi:hypothetical protein
MARLRLLLERHRQADREPTLVAPVAPTPDLEGASAGGDADAPPPAAEAPRDPYRRAAAAPDAKTPPERDEEMERALAGAWSLARCDARLTRRLGLL